MIRNRSVNVLAVLLIAVALFFSLRLALMENNPATEQASTQEDYATKLFGGEMISVEILVEEETWQQMLSNASAEEYICVDVVVNGTSFQNVGLRTKGNSSLSQVQSSDSERYSFRLNFGKYIDGQTCFGLDKLVLNNMIGDNSYMKEYLSYALMQEVGVPAPCFDFANISLNGETWGLYLAVELYDESYEERVFGDSTSALYNVKSMEMGADDGGGQLQAPDGAPPSLPEGVERAETEHTDPAIQTETAAPSAETTTTADTLTAPSEENRVERRGMGGMGERGSSGGSLEYSDDDSDSYSAIFGNVVGKGSESDFQRVIAALKTLQSGENLEESFDVDEILRYLAAHTLVVNLDSYSSSMAQNYYLCERDGVLSVLPWDYNMAWGGFQSGSASSVVNFPIDTPVSGVTMESRPLISMLLAQEDYLARYHSYLQELLDAYFANGAWEETITALDQRIGDYVANDQTAFCSYENYQTAVSALKTLGVLRVQSVQGQLDGSIPATTETQQENPGALVQTGTLQLSDLGSMNGGKGGDIGAGMNVSGERPTAETDTRIVPQDGQTSMQGMVGDKATVQTKPSRAVGMTPPNPQSGTSISGETRLWIAISLASLLVAGFVVHACRRRY